MAMTETTSTGLGRRDLLKGAGAAATGAAIAAAVPANGAAAAQAPKRDAPRWAMVMDLRRCIGCRACTIACKTENGVPIGNWWAVIQENMHGTFPNTKKTFVPLMCNHCEGNEKDKVPPCVKICPEWPADRKVYVTPNGKKIRYRDGATYKRPDGMILLDNSKCIGCGKCIEACPYGVRSFNPLLKAGKKPEENGIAKCNLCVHRVDKGIEPSCVNTCQGRARIFGDLNDPDSEVSKLAKEHGLLENREKSTLIPDKNAYPDYTYPHVFYIDPDNILKTGYRGRVPKKLDHFRDEIV
jgi:tetrathionate reductase subunit B